MSEEDTVQRGSEAKAICAKHGDCILTFIEVPLVPERIFPLCPYCWGERMRQQFPVTPVEEVEDAEAKLL